MQEKFALRKTLKKVAAVGTSLAMIGITVSGALAAGLGDYPGALGFSNNRLSTAVVYGADSDMDAANDVAVGLPGAAVSATQPAVPTTSTGLQYGVADLGTAQASDLFDAGTTQNVVIENTLNASANFGNALKNSRVSSLKTGTTSISIGGVSGSYNYHEEVRFGSDGSGNEPAVSFNGITAATVETGLSYNSNRDKRWKENVFIQTPSNSIGYYYVFDANLKQGNYLANATTTEPVAINFLGQDVEIQAATSTSVTMNVGKSLRLKAGETASVNTGIDTVTVTFNGASSSSQAGVTITGPKGTKTQIITNNAATSFNGVSARPLQVRVQDVFNDNDIQFDSATVVIGLCAPGSAAACDARTTASDADRYVGEDLNNPIWVWDLNGLTTGTATQVRLGVTLALTLDNSDETDNTLIKHPLYTGEYLCLPNFYACVVFEKMTQSDDSFRHYEVRTDTKDLYWLATDTTAQISNARVLEVKAKGTNNQGITAGGQDTQEVYVYVNRSGFSLYRRDTTSGTKAVNFASNVSNGPVTGQLSIATVYNNAFNLNYGSTQEQVDVLYDFNTTVGTNSGSVQQGVLVFDTTGNATNYATLGVAEDLSGGTGVQPFNATGLISLASRGFGLAGHLNDGDLVVYFENSSENQITYLGHSSGDTTTAADLVYADGDTLDGYPSNNPLGLMDISGWDQNTRTKEGILVFNPSSRKSGDSTEIGLPSDINNYKAVVRIASPKGGVVSTAPGSDTTASASIVVKDTDVLATYSTLNVVAVGGPCVNQVTAALLGVTFPACGDASGLSEGVATLSLKPNGSKQALLVYGWAAEDTRRAAVLAKSPAELQQKLTAAGKASATDVSVKGVGLEVSGLSVA